MSARNLSAIVSIHSNRGALRKRCALNADEQHRYTLFPLTSFVRFVPFARALVTVIALSLALSGCGVFCNIGGGSGGVGGSCGVGTGFRF